MSATPGLTVYPKGVLLETLRRRIIALQEEGYNDDFLRAIREAHRELDRKGARLAEVEGMLEAAQKIVTDALDERQRDKSRLAEVARALKDCAEHMEWSTPQGRAAWAEAWRIVGAADSAPAVCKECDGLGWLDYVGGTLCKCAAHSAAPVQGSASFTGSEQAETMNSTDVCPDCQGKGGTLPNGVQFCNCEDSPAQARITYDLANPEHRRWLRQFLDAAETVSAGEVTK